MRPVQRVLRALGTTLLTLAVIGGLAYGGYKAADAKLPLKLAVEVRPCVGRLRALEQLSEFECCECVGHSGV